MHQFVWSSEALIALSELDYNLTNSGCCWRTLNPNEQLPHCAVSLRQQGFLVINRHWLYRTELLIEPKEHFYGILQIKQWNCTYKILKTQQNNSFGSDF